MSALLAHQLETHINTAYSSKQRRPRPAPTGGLSSKTDFAGNLKFGIELYIKLEYNLKLKIRRTDWLLLRTCPEATNQCVLF